MATILAISGSLRERSYNTMLLRNARDEAPLGVAVEIYRDLASIPLFSEDLEGPGVPAAVVKLWNLVSASDGLLIATPEYNQSFPGIIKNAIDWISRSPDNLLTGKPVAVIGATVGQWGTRLAQSGLRSVLHCTQADLVHLPQLYVRAANREFDEDGHLKDRSTRESLARIMLGFAGAISSRAVNSQRAVC